jgi:diaminopimelate decarboxylase
VISGIKRQIKRTLKKRYAKDTQWHPHLPISDFELVSSAEGLQWRRAALKNLAENFGTPLHVMSFSKLEKNARAIFNSAEADRLDVFYSYKTNPVPGILRRLHALGIGAEVISAYEYDLARHLGVDPGRIVFNGPCKSREAIARAIHEGVGLLTANHFEEIDLIATLAEKAKRKTRAGIRIETGTGWAEQFGSSMREGTAMAAVEKVKNSPHLDLVALHCHRGGTMRSLRDVQQFVDPVLAFADAAYQKFGLNFEILNLGGSMPSPTVKDLGAYEQRLNQTFAKPPLAPNVGETLTPAQYRSLAIELVTEHFKRKSRPIPKIYIEPGRAMTSNTQLLLTRVQLEKKTKESHYLLLDAGINHAESTRSEYHELFHVTANNDARTHLYVCAGPICSPGDVLYPNVALPETRVGDVLAMMDSGAYLVPFSTSFSFPQPGIVALDADGNSEWIRRPETFQDMRQRDVGV